MTQKAFQNYDSNQLTTQKVFQHFNASRLMTPMNRTPVNDLTNQNDQFLPPGSGFRLGALAECER